MEFKPNFPVAGDNDLIGSDTRTLDTDVVRHCTWVINDSGGRDFHGGRK